MKNKIFLTITLLILTANAGLCEQTRTVAVQDIAIKFGLAMIGVVVSSFIIFAGLAIYNKIRENSSKTNLNIEDDILKTPKSVDSAIKFFIQKNKLR